MSAGRCSLGLPNGLDKPTKAIELVDTHGASTGILRSSNLVILRLVRTSCSQFQQSGDACTQILGNTPTHTHTHTKKRKESPVRKIGNPCMHYANAYALV